MPQNHFLGPIFALWRWRQEMLAQQPRPNDVGMHVSLPGRQKAMLRKSLRPRDHARILLLHLGLGFIHISIGIPRDP